MNRTMHKAPKKHFEMVDLEVRPRSEAPSFRDVSLSAMHFSHSDKGLETERPPNPKMVHLPKVDNYGNISMNKSDNMSENIL
jgi:hypothetical protein